MHKDQAREHIEKDITEGDELIGFFQATYFPRFWWLLVVLVTPIAVLTMRIYFVGVSKQGLCFYKLTFMGKFCDADFFKYDEIDSVKVGRGFLQRPMVFRFMNGRKLRLKGQLKGLGKIAKLTPEVSDYIGNNIAAPE